MKREFQSSSNSILLRLILVVLLAFSHASLLSAQTAHAYSAINERPAFLAWPLPYYIGLARISQFPNTPWTWNYVGLNPNQQCPPAFGYLANAEFWNVWKDPSLPEKQEMAKADPNNFEMVNCYSTLGEAGKNGHEGTDIKAPSGTPVYASATGKVAGWWSADLNSMIVLKHCQGGQWDAAGNCIGDRKWYTTYMHIVLDNNLLQMEKDVVEGDQVATIYNQGDNSHLHFEVGVEKRSYENYINPWGRDEAPWLGCMWKDQTLCTQPNPGYERIAFLTQSNRFFVRDDNSLIANVMGVEEVKQIEMAGHRMALVDQNGHLLAADVEFKRNIPFSYDFVRNWDYLGDDFVDYQITNNRLAVLDADGRLKVWEGDLLDGQLLQAEHVQSFSVSAHRVGILTTTGELKVQEDNLNADWMQLASNVKAFQVLDSRIAVADLQGNLFVQEGALTNEWKPMASNIQAFQLAGKRVAVIDGMGSLLVNDGNLRAEWVLQAANIRHFQLSDNRILVLDQDGIWKIKEGDLYQEWKRVIGLPIKDARLNGELPVWIK